MILETIEIELCFKAGTEQLVAESAVPTGGRLQLVLMRHTPQLSVKTRGGGGGGGGGGAELGGGPAGGRGGSGRGGGSGWGSGGVLPGVWGGPAGVGGGVWPGVRGASDGVRGGVRVRVTELVEPVLVL